MAAWITSPFRISVGQSFLCAWLTVRVWCLLAKRKVVWGGNSPWRNSPSACKESFLHMCGQGRLLTLEMRTPWTVQGPASSLNSLTILVLEFPSIGNESPIALPWWWGGGVLIYLLPQFACHEKYKNIMYSLKATYQNGKKWKFWIVSFSVCISHSVMSDSLWPHDL